MSNNTYTVSTLTQSIKNLLENDIGNVWVEGEISNFTRASSGHMYMSLKDSDSVIRLVAFKNLGSVLKFKLCDGQKVLVSGKLTVYGVRGEYQIIASYMEPLGVGALQLAFDQLKEKLSKEGLFDDIHKKQIPFLPKRVGVITSPTGAAVRDILNVTERRCALTSILINPVKVQGEGSAEEIAEAIDLFNDLDNVDVIIVGRGGGSLEDLWAFNEEMVARSIFNSKIPVVSAVGHEIDFSIADFVSDLRAPTPSAAAELVVPDTQDVKEKINFLYNKFSSELFKKLELYKHRIFSLKNHYVFRESAGVIKNYIQRIDEFDIRLQNTMNFYIKNTGSCLKLCVDKLETLSPLKVLSRGYSVSVVGDSGKVVKNVGDVEVGNKIKTVLQDGEVVSVVETKFNF